MTQQPEQVLHHYRNHHDKFIEMLKDLTRIPGIGFPGFPAEELDKSAAAVKTLMERTGLENVAFLEVPGAPPYVYGDWLHAPGAPTLLLYAHYDVQPPMREELWKSPAFEPVERDGRLYGRGTADDKAGIILHLASIGSYLDTQNNLPVNVRVIIEGEEETGSTHLERFLSMYSGQLTADSLIIADVANYDIGVPSLTTSLRGLVGMEVTVTALNSPLHSGLWGGPLPDPVMALSKMLSGLIDDEGEIAVPGLLDDVRPPTADEMEDLRKLSMTDELFRKQSGLKEGAALFGTDEELLLRIWKKPSLLINSVLAGGKEAGNVILDKAAARIGLRLVPDMDPDRCAEILTGFLKSACPWGLEVTVSVEAGVGAWHTSTDHPIFETAKLALKKGYGAEAVYIGSGGTIPLADPVSRAFGDIPVLLVGVEDPYTNAHSENESLCLTEFHKAVESQIHFFSDLAQSGNH